MDYLKELGVPVLRWPGGCYADDYHWREGIGPAAKRPRHVNINWGDYVEDNSFGTHEFMSFCRLIGAEPYFAANVGTGSPREMRDWIEYCNFPSGSTLSDERAANGSPEPFNVRYWGVGNELWGCGGNFRPEAAGAEFRHYATFARTVRRHRAIPGGLRPLRQRCHAGRAASWTRCRQPPSQWLLHALLRERKPAARGIHARSRDTPSSTCFPRVEQAIIQQRALLDGYDPGRRIGLILDEWGVWDRIPKKDRAATAPCGSSPPCAARWPRAWAQHLQPPGRQAVHVQHRADGQRAAIGDSDRRAGRQEQRPHHHLLGLHAVQAAPRQDGRARWRATLRRCRSKQAGAEAAAPRRHSRRLCPSSRISASRQGHRVGGYVREPAPRRGYEVDCALRGVKRQRGAGRRSCTIPTSTPATASTIRTG